MSNNESYGPWSIRLEPIKFKTLPKTLSLLLYIGYIILIQFIHDH